MIATIIIIVLLLAAWFVVSVLWRSSSPQELLRKRDLEAYNRTWDLGDGGHHRKDDWDRRSFD